MKARDIALLTVTREISGNVQVVSYFEMTIRMSSESQKRGVFTHTLLCIQRDGCR